MNQEDLISILKKRFEKNVHLHPNIKWSEVNELLTETIMVTLAKMEETGGEPSFVLLNGSYYYVDLSEESPLGRRSLCYDQEARLNRKKFPPVSSALELANEIGINILDEDMYLSIQRLQPIDLKTSSWIRTNDSIRSLNGAIFGDNRFQRAFIYHNGAESYYKDRGFRGFIKLK